MAQTNEEVAGTSYSHIDTRLSSSTLPLALRILEPRDASALAGLLSDPANMLYESPNPPKPMSVETATAVINAMRGSATKPTIVGPDGRVRSGPGRVNLAIVETGATADDEVMIGLGGFGGINEKAGKGADSVPERSGDVGAMINTAYRGKGYALESIRLAVEWALRDAADGGLQLDRITAGTLAENTPMLGLLEKKLGWQGKRQSAGKDWEGKAEVVFSETRDTWKKA